ncbi:MAG: folate-binding protein, partial [Anaerolineae bacterium]|nr:folate-binding protein [Anaerolineae bacterium]
MTLLDQQTARGAVVATDGIPLHYGDERREYHAALTSAVLMDRSHEGRFEIAGSSRLDLPHRISTNDLLTLAPGEGRPTIFINANARILDRATIYHRGEMALVLTEPGRGAPLRAYLQRNIFFNDDARLRDLADSTRQFVIHGATADAIGESVAPGLVDMH